MHDGAVTPSCQERCQHIVTAVRFATGCTMLPFVWGVLIPVTLAEAGVRLGCHLVGQWMHPCRNWPYPK